ncbi:MAG: HupE/UreJ family protein [Alphaproteobacteria bacterium]|nr:HupE/UreJ family protein [Alphaproteobacteria bacterium]
MYFTHSRYNYFSLIILFFIITFLAGAGQRSFSHEIMPAISELSFQEEQVNIDIVLSIELFIAEIDASIITDTNNSDKSNVYDELRSLDSNQLKQIFTDKYSSFAELLTIRSNMGEIRPRLAHIKVIENNNLSYPRESKISLVAPLTQDDTEIEFGWNKQLGPLIVRQVLANAGNNHSDTEDELYTTYLSPGNISDPISRSGVTDVSGTNIIVDYLIIGFEHIIPKGLDHILFVLGLYLFATKFSQLIAQISLFTLAHTTTLALATMGVVSVPAHIVEPLIALSISYIALETIWHTRIGWSRLIIIFIFGLLHGLGFASVLMEIGLSQQYFITSLIAFNVGVEIGQITVVCLAFLLIGIWFSHRRFYRPFIQIPFSVVIAAIGGWWFVERVFLGG